MRKPELLLPAGNAETFHAAVEGGADAVYLGLRMFNARGRASNFSHVQLWALLQEAKKSNVKVFLTVNTLIKNEELPDLLEFLHFISCTKLDAIIIQDWGVYYLVKRHFPKITLHASTQMGIHNSLGTQHAHGKKFTRAVVARELRFDELKSIRKKSKIELEVFVHGALCYSFSGMCMFSSFLGGAGANRGLCAQPCRRNFFAEGDEKGKYFFSLKDNQQIGLIPEMTKMGIDSFKVEGRMKSAEYVNTVARAYNMAIEDAEKVDEAREILKYDTGREKTAYFLDNDVKDAITDNPNTGYLLGTVVRTDRDGFYINASEDIEEGYRLRIKSHKSDSQITIKIRENFSREKGLWFISHEGGDVEKRDTVFIAAKGGVKFSSKLPSVDMPRISINYKLKNEILKEFKTFKAPKEELFVRIDSLQWLKKIYIQSVNYVIINLNKTEWSELDVNATFLQRNKGKLIFELPKFIAEKDILFYQNLCKKVATAGFNNFMISHISQKRMLAKGVSVFTNENVYVLNDAAAVFMKKEEHVRCFSYPQENDFQNLRMFRDKSGIVPLYFHPELFYSRMPVKADAFKDDKDNEYQKMIKDGISIVVPVNPVVLLQQKDKLQDVGYNRFLIDLSFEKPSSNAFNTIIKRYKESRQIQPSHGFNFKLGLK